MFRLFNNYYPDEAIGAGGELNKDSILDILSSDKEDEEPIKQISKDSKENKDSKEDDKDEEVEEEIEIADPEEEKEIKVADEDLDDLELVTPFKRKEILKKYPDIFKDFPYLETSYRRERQYNEIFPTLDSAKEAVDKAQSLDNFEATLLKGNTSDILKIVKTNNEESFKKIVDNYLPNLAAVDEKAYFHVLGNVFKHAIQNMKRESATSKDEDLGAAADILSKFVFGHTEAGQPTTLAKPESQTNEVELERQEFMKERFDTALSDVNGRVENALKVTIDVNLDPKKSMSDYVRKAASKEVLDNVYAEITKDSRFSKILDNLWKEASTKKFDKASTDRIRAAFLSKAKTVLPTLIRNARNEALKGQTRSTKTEDKVIKRTASLSSDNGSKTKKDAIPKGMTTLDYFNQE